jgi:hypothetical protein
VFVYWDFHAGSLFLCLAPFPWSRVSVLSAPPAVVMHVVMVQYLFFNFVGQFDFGCCSVVQEMSSVIHYLPCFSLPFQHLFTEVLLRLASCPSPISGALSVILPLLLCARLQFTVYCSVFLEGVSMPRGAVLIYPEGGWGNST